MKKYCKLLLIPAFIFAALASVNAQNNVVTEEDVRNEEWAEYQQQTRELITYFQETLNFIGDPATVTKEKEIVITNSYLKMFRDSEVQIEDDLDENRIANLSKDVQAYLKDIDFFFRQVTFEFTVEELVRETNEKGEPYILVTTTRNLQGETIDGKAVNNTCDRFFEILINEENRELKIVSIYTKKLDETTDMLSWWDNLDVAWQLLFEQKLDVEEVSYSDLQKLQGMEGIDISGNKDITTLEPLSKLRKLRKINASGTSISQISPLRSLAQLEILDISDTKVASLSHLKYARSLRNLFAANTAVSDLAVLEGLETLERLNIENTQVGSLAPLKNCRLLKDLRLSGTQVNDLSPVGEAVSLEVLKINGLKVSDLSPLQNMKALRSLELSGTTVTDLSPISGLSSLQVIYFDNTSIASLAPLESITSLKKIYCDKTGIRQKEAKAFTASHPGVLVVYESESLLAWWKDLPDTWKTAFTTRGLVTEKPDKEALHALISITDIDFSGDASISDLTPLTTFFSLQNLNLAHTPVSNLAPLSALTDLRFLNCASTKVTDISPLAKLSNLERLNFAGTGIASVSPLAACTALDTLNIERTRVSSLHDLRNITSLRIIYADASLLEADSVIAFNDSNPCLVVFRTPALNDWWNGLSPVWKNLFGDYVKFKAPVSPEDLHRIANLETIEAGSKNMGDLKALSMLGRLKTLTVTDAGITDIGPLQSANRLEKLNLSKNYISDIAPLQGLKKLQTLILENNPVKELDALNNITSIETLNVAGTLVKQLKPLETLANLKHLDISNTKVMWLGSVSDLGLQTLKCFKTSVLRPLVNDFQKKNPSCKVIYY